MTHKREPLSTRVIDNFNTYTPVMIYTSLWSDVVTVNQLRNDLLLRSGNVQAAQVNQLVQSYGY